MTSLFSQASPPPYTIPLSTPPPSPSIKRKRDQILSPSGKDSFGIISLDHLLTKIIIERNYKVRKHWVPKANRNQEHETECNIGSQHSNVPQKPVRKSTRARSKVSYKVDDAMEE
jgi:hypothetical protein